MIPYEFRAPNQSLVPRNVAVLNVGLVSGRRDVDLTDLALTDEKIVHAWQGVVGQFVGAEVEVSTKFVPENYRSVGYLGALQIVELGADVPTLQIPHPRLRFTNDSRYRGPAIVAKLLSDFDEDGLPKHESMFVVSWPNGTPHGDRALIRRTSPLKYVDPKSTMGDANSKSRDSLIRQYFL
ncbi:hypothetical protein KBB49_04420 [Candidatus Saccharibacteria bacterium]|nr:hypothetical protein [Candidatus Saccharibacteria bacterium]